MCGQRLPSPSPSRWPQFLGALVLLTVVAWALHASAAIRVDGSEFQSSSFAVRTQTSQLKTGATAAVVPVRMIFTLGQAVMASGSLPGSGDSGVVAFKIGLGYEYNVLGTSYNCICNCHGDPECDGIIDVFDVVLTVGVAFRGEAPVTGGSCPHETTDIDCNNLTDALDVVSFVNIAFREADPAGICTPCAE